MENTMVHLDRSNIVSIRLKSGFLIHADKLLGSKKLYYLPTIKIFTVKKEMFVNFMAHNVESFYPGTVYIVIS